MKILSGLPPAEPAPAELHRRPPPLPRGGQLRRAGQVDPDSGVRPAVPAAHAAVAAAAGPGRTRRRSRWRLPGVSPVRLGGPGGAGGRVCAAHLPDGPVGEWRKGGHYCTTRPNSGFRFVPGTK